MVVRAAIPALTFTSEIRQMGVNRVIPNEQLIPGPGWELSATAIKQPVIFRQPARSVMVPIYWDPQRGALERRAAIAILPETH